MPRRSVSQYEQAMVEAKRYARAGLAGVAIAFVMFVASPQIPITYVLAVGFFVAAGILVWVND